MTTGRFPGSRLAAALPAGFLFAFLFLSPGAHAFAPLSGVAQVAAGGNHACALTAAGGVKCWGQNNNGQLGDGSTTTRPYPVDVVGLASGVARVVAGEHFTCALTTAGGVKCWGLNGTGQLGDGTSTSRAVPGDVSGLASGVAGLAAGAFHACAVTTSGAAKCWGGNAFDGRLGDGTLQNRSTPVDVVGLAAGVQSISAGSTHTCAVTSGGAALCWGSNFWGKLGDGNTGFGSSTPVAVQGLASGTAAIAAGGDHTCALTTAGAVKCWGRGDFGRTGLGSASAVTVPTDVAGLPSGVSAISTGSEHTCAVAAAGAVKCWGRNYYGQVGDGTTEDRFTPADVSGLASGATSVAAGGNHNCALLAGGEVRCWGRKDYGQLGDGTADFSPSPVEVVGLSSGVSGVSPGLLHTCALTAAGGVKCWGHNASGRLGDGTTTARLTPVDVVGLSAGAAGVSAAPWHNCALTTAGGVKCWGYNGAGQVGAGATIDQLVPFDVPGLSTGMAGVGAGDDHSCALTAAGGVKCWGANYFGQLGDGTTTFRPAPVDVVGLSAGATRVVTGQQHTCALMAAGGVKCWGGNLNGQLGDGTTTNRIAPVDVAGLSAGVTGVAFRAGHVCALTAAGGVKCWGDNSWGQLGDGTTQRRLAPVDVLGLAAGATGVSAGESHSCAVTASGGVKCWGRNSVGQLGSGTTGRLVPSDVEGLTSGVTSVASGLRHSCALTAAGGLKCWGYNYDGQLGNGTGYFRPVPAAVIVVDTTPDAFAFASEAGVPLVSSRTSDAVAFAGIDYETPVSVANGEYSVDCNGLFTSAPGFLAPGQTVCVRHDSAPTPLTAVTTTLTVGGVPASFTSTTALEATVASLGFGGQSMNTTSPGRTILFNNITGSPLAVDSVAASPGFAVTHDCASLAVAASCSITVTFTPGAEGSVPGTLTIATGAGTSLVSLAGTGERSLVTHYYQSILRRAPDADGKLFWTGEAARTQSLGLDENEAWYAMAMAFFTSAEYRNANRSDSGFVTDLYTAFFNRAPDAPGLAFWTGELAGGMPREVALVSFLFSTEFVNFTRAIFGTTSVRAEMNAVTDFYRGYLGRVPDNSGFAYWLGRFRTAQCQGDAAVTAEASFMSLNFGTSAEYRAKGRLISQYVGDLYNAFLRRGGDLAGVLYWINEITTGARTREEVRQQFVASPEFQARIAAIIAQGCLP